MIPLLPAALAGLPAEPFDAPSVAPAAAWLALGAAWLVVGLGVAVALARRGEPTPTAAAALLFWPLLAPTLLAAPTSDRVRDAFDRLRDALRDAGEPVPPDLDALRATLIAAEARLARIARLVAEEPDAAPAEVAALREAHARAAAELDAVLAEVGRVRVQLGLASLAGDTAAVRARVGDLLARARTLHEVAELRAILPPR